MKKSVYYRIAAMRLYSYAIISLLAIFVFTTSVSAQHVFGYFNYDEVVKQLPNYDATMKQLDELKAKFKEETVRVEKDFNEKYEEFLEGQKEFPAIILQKRQTELQEMMEKNVAFKQEARRLYAKAKQEAMDSLRQVINKAVAEIGELHKYDFIMNADETSCPWVNPEKGVCLNKEILKVIRH